MSVPKLRFKEFDGEWTKLKLEQVLDRCSFPVQVKQDTLYQQIGIRSHGKGIFYKDLVSGKSLGNKRVFWIKPDALILNIVFAWEQAVAKTTIDEDGMIASHRFPMYLPRHNRVHIDFLRRIFLTDKGKTYLELASPGGAGRNKTLGQKIFEALEIPLPIIEEQTKIANFLTTIDDYINQLTRKHSLLTQYKKAAMQQIFSQQLRFKDENGEDFADWEEFEVGDIFKVTRGSVLSMTMVKEHQDSEYFYPVYSSQTKNKGLSGYYKEYLYENCITWTTDGANAGEVNYREGKFYCTNVCGVLINLDGYANSFIAALIDSVSRKYVSYVGNPKLMNNVMNKIRITAPSVAEQIKIAKLLTQLDQQLDQLQQQINQIKQYKQGLLQQMFV